MPGLQESPLEGKVVVVKPQEEAVSRQRLSYYVGISRGTAGATALALHLVVVPPGGVAEPHIHEGYETAIYQLEGRVETRYGERLEHAVVTEAGDFLFIPPGVPHQAVNLSVTERAVGVVARSDAGEQERVIRYVTG